MSCFITYCLSNCLNGNAICIFSKLYCMCVDWSKSIYKARDKRTRFTYRDAWVCSNFRVFSFVCKLTRYCNPTASLSTKYSKFLPSPVYFLLMCLVALSYCSSCVSSSACRFCFLHNIASSRHSGPSFVHQFILTTWHDVICIRLISFLHTYLYFETRIYVSYITYMIIHLSIFWW